MSNRIVTNITNIKDKKKRTNNINVVLSAVNKWFLIILDNSFYHGSIPTQGTRESPLLNFFG